MGTVESRRTSFESLVASTFGDFNVLKSSLYSRCLTMLVLLSFVLKLTTPMGSFDLKEKEKMKKIPCALLDFAHFLGPETSY